MEGLGSWNIVSFLNDEFLRRISWIFVFGNSGNEVLLFTNDDEVYVMGANTNCCLGMTRSYQVGLEPKRLEKLCGKGVINISAGNGPHVLALTGNGEVYSWGHNGYGQLGHGDTAIHTRIPTIVSHGLEGVIIHQVACGAYHSMALSKNGEVFTWGFNNCGQLGHGDINSRYNPTKVSRLLEGVLCKMVSCAYSSSYTITQCGKVYSWGQNGCGQLGIGTTTQQTEPRIALSLLNTLIKKIVSGYSHVLCLSDNHDLYTWGANTHGQLGNGTKINQLSPIAVGKEIEKRIQFSFNVGCFRFIDIGATNLCRVSAAECINGKILMWGECCHQIIATPLETDLHCIDQVFAKYASPSCSWQPFRVNTTTNTTTTGHSTVSQCIENRFNDPDTSDLTFIVNGQRIFVHKAILRMRSSYFYSMLKIGSWIEGTMNSVEVNNYSSETFYSFLKYLYTDKIDSTMEDIPSLLELADLYCEFSLKEQCSRILCRQINGENALSLYFMSLQYKLKELEDSSFCYALKHSSAIIKSSAFVELDGLCVKQLVLKMAENGAFKS